MAEVVSVVASALFTLKFTLAARSITVTPHETHILLASEVIVSEERKLRSTLELILYNTLSPDEIEKLFQDTQSPRWKSPEVKTAFLNALGDSGYDEFLHSLRNSIDTLSALQGSISRLSSLTRDIDSDSRRSLQLQSILRRRKTQKEIEKIEKQMEELWQRNKSLDSYVAASAFSRSMQARQNLDDAARVFSGMEALTRQTAEAMSSICPDTSSVGGDGDAMSIMTDVGKPIPHEPEKGKEGAKLRYLDVKIQSDPNGSASQSRAGRLREKALLDSSATDNFISVALAHKLGLEMPDEPEIGEIRTLVPSGKRFTAWKAKVILRWEDKEGKPHHFIIDVHVARETNLGKNLILCQEFMSNHEEVWDVSTQVPESDMQLNTTFLDRLRPEDKKKQAELLAEVEKRNRARHEAERTKKQEAKSKQGSLDASKAGTSTRSDPGPSNTSSG